MKKNAVHHGYNVKRLREMLGIKQDVLAESIGISQQTFSRIEKRERLDDELLEKISAEIKIPVDCIKNFDKEKAIEIISVHFQNRSGTENITHSPPFDFMNKMIDLVLAQDKRISLLEKCFLDSNKSSQPNN